MEHEYLTRLKKAVALGLLDSISSALVQCSVGHDDWCAMRNLCGPCNCDPEIKINTDRGLAMVQKDGTLKFTKLN